MARIPPTGTSPGGSITTPAEGSTPFGSNTGFDRESSLTGKVDAAAGHAKLGMMLSIFIAILCVVIVALGGAVVWEARFLINTSTKKQVDDAVALLVSRPGTWQRINPVSAVPPPRLAHAAVAVGNMLYIHGGLLGASTNVFSDLWRYDERFNEWVQLFPTGDIPSARLHHSLVEYDANTLLMFGGFNNFQGQANHRSFDDLYSLDLTTLTWTRLDTSLGSTARPSSRGAHDCVVLNGFMYLFGGFPIIAATGHSHELWRFSLATRTWVNLTPANPTDSTWPDPRIGFAWAEVNGMGHLFGGGCPFTADDSFNGQCGDDWLFDPSTETFRMLATTNPPSHRRATHGDVSAFGFVFLFGGVYIDSSGPRMFDDLHVLDVQAGRWMQLYPNYLQGDRPSPVFGHSVSRINDKLVIFGGRVGSPASQGSNDLWEYTIVHPQPSR